MDNLSPSAHHEWLNGSTVQRLAYRDQEFDPWKLALTHAFHELFGWQSDKPRLPLNMRVLSEKEEETYIDQKIVFQSEPGADVPGHILTPKGAKGPLPAFICLQGHTSGMHISLGQAIYDGDEAQLGGDRDFGLQAVSQGYVALVLEQRCFGERRETLQEQRHSGTCEDAAMRALLLGHTLASERAWDASRGIDLLESLPQVRRDRICCMGNSGGGTTTFYTACVDERIYLAMPSCAFCTYADSLFRISHCPDNYIPGILQIAEMGDLTGMIAPRRLIIVAGSEDSIFPIAGVRQAYSTAKEIYEAAGAPERLKLVVGEGPHRFYAKQGWATVAEMLQAPVPTRIER